MPDGIKPLPETMLTSHQRGSVAVTREQFHSECPSYYSVYELGNHAFKLNPRLPEASELTYLNIHSHAIWRITSKRLQRIYYRSVASTPADIPVKRIFDGLRFKWRLGIGHKAEDVFHYQ